MSLEKWSQRYDISLDPIECYSCNKEIYPEIPFADKEYRGFIFEPCGCEHSPKDQTPFRCAPIDPEERQSYRDMVKLLCEK